MSPCGFLASTKKRTSRKFGGEMKCVIGPALASRSNGAFNFDFLLVRIGLAVVVYIPAECNEELVNEVLSDFDFLIVGGEVTCPRWL